MEEVHEDYLARAGSLVVEGRKVLVGMARIKTKIRKGDTVMVVTGRERGKSGKVLSVDTINGKVLVEKLNMIKRHTKANPQLGTAGGILEKEASMHVSNVGLVNPVTGKADRVGYKVLEDKTKVRVFRSTGEVIDG